eukprot:6211892-Pleurochrysis_carterae.AAC.2
MPCCYDALSARLVEQAGFPLTFVSGFSVSASRALPDTGLLSYGEMLDSMRNVSAAVCIPCIGDGDTGYGNEVNVKRTVRGYVRAAPRMAVVDVAEMRLKEAVPCLSTVRKTLAGEHCIFAASVVWAE